MLYKEQDIYQKKDIIIPYIDRTFHESSPSTIPLIEFNSYKNKPIVRYKDLLQLQEDQEYNSIQETIDAIKHHNGIQHLTISMEEWRPIADPTLLSSISEECVFVKEDHGPVYDFCKECMDAFMETHDMTYVNIFLEADNADAQQKRIQTLQGKYDNILAAKRAVENNPNLKNDPNAQAKLSGLDKQLADVTKRLNKAKAGLSALNQSQAASQAQGISQLQNKDVTPANQKLSQDQMNAKKEEIRNRLNFKKQSGAPNAQPGFWAQKWTAFRNWMNNLGNNQSNQNNQWFTNMIDKVKSFFNGQAAQASSSNVANKVANSTSDVASNVVSDAINQAKNSVDEFIGKGIGKAAEFAQKLGVDQKYIDAASNMASDFSKQKTMELAQKSNEHANTKIAAALS